MAFIKKAYDISRKEVFFCKSSKPIADIAKIMYQNNIGSILVRDDDTLKGIITTNDLLRQMARGVDSYKVRAENIMSSPVVTASKDLEMDELVDEFNKHKVSRMVLVDKDNKIVGVVRDIAVYKYLTFFKFEEEVKKRFARDYMHKLY